MTFEERAIFQAWLRLALPQAANVSYWDQPLVEEKAG